MPDVSLRNLFPLSFPRLPSRSISKHHPPRVAVGLPEYHFVLSVRAVVVHFIRNQSKTAEDGEEGVSVCQSHAVPPRSPSHRRKHLGSQQ